MILEILNNYFSPKYFFVTTMFFTIKKYFQHYSNSEKLGINLTSLTHACTSTLLTTLYLYQKYFNNYESLILDNTIRTFSAGYFIYDNYNCIKNYKGTLRIAYIYHHFASLLALMQYSSTFKVHELLFCAELSNISSYIVYYYLHQKKKENYSDTKEYFNTIKNLKLWKKIQKYMYCFIRIPILGYIAIDAVYLNFNNSEMLNKVLFTMPVYLMGLIWSYKLVNDK